MATDYGTDISTQVLNEDGLPDLDPFFRKISGQQAVAESVLRKIEPILLQEIDGDHDVASLFHLNARIAAAAQEDERVADTTITVTLGTDEILRFEGQIYTAEGPFDFTGFLDDAMIARLTDPTK